MRPKKLLLIFNPHSGKGEFAAKLYEVVDHFTKAGFEVTVRPTQEKNDARDFIVKRAPVFDCICCAGGDGMASELANAAMMLEKRPVFGFIPTGTTNDFAFTLGLKKDPVLAAETVISGIACDIDTGRFGDRYFAYVAAFGLFTDVPYVTSQDMKNMLGHTAYLLEGAMRLGSIISHNLEFDIDGEKFYGNFIFGMASNAMSVGGFKLPAGAVIQPDDGLFEVLLVKTPKNMADLQKIIASLINQTGDDEALLFRQAKSLRIISQEPIEWTLDGEFGGSTTDVLIQNKQRAFELMVPRPKISGI